MIAPYWDCNFFEFFIVFAKRLIFIATGQIPMATDEIQIFVLLSIAVSCGVLGPFLVLKRLTMLANSIAHTVLLGIAVSYICCGCFFSIQSASLPFIVLFPGTLAAALLTVVLTFIVNQWLRLQEDASIGLVFTSLFALGIAMVTLFTRDVHLGIEAVMGNADVLQMSDLHMGLILASISSLAILLCYIPLKYSSFDSAHMASMGAKEKCLQALLLFLTAVSAIGAFRIVGVLLVLSFLVGPYLIARLFSHELKSLLFLTVGIGSLASLIGVALARHIFSVYGLPLSTGGIVSVLIALFYSLSLGICRIKSKFNELRLRKNE